VPVFDLDNFAMAPLQAQGTQRRARGLRPHVHAFDRDGEHWRGAVLVSVNSYRAKLRILIASGFQREKEVSAARVPADTVGAPLAVKISNTDPDGFSIEKIVGSHWPPGGGPGSDEARAVALASVGEWPYFFGCVPREITGESEFF
jgi:hypothetical protein